jgi:hypothetical protein
MFQKNDSAVEYRGNLGMLTLSSDTMEEFLELPEVVAFLNNLKPVKLLKDDGDNVIWSSEDNVIWSSED